MGMLCWKNISLSLFLLCECMLYWFKVTRAFDGSVKSFFCPLSWIAWWVLLFSFYSFFLVPFSLLKWNQWFCMPIDGVEWSAYKFKTDMNCQMKNRYAWRHNWSRAHAIIVILLSSVLFRTIWPIPLPILNWLDHGRSFSHLYLMIIKMGITCISM